MDGRDRAAPTEDSSGRSDEGVGQRVGQGGSEDRLAAATTTERLQGFAEAMGGGTHLFVVGPESQVEQGL